MQNFEKLIKKLLDHKVEFVLIGGFAATVHGVSLLTQDIDICIPFTKENLEKIISALQDSNPIYRENKIPLSNSAEKLSKLKNLYLTTDFGSLDLLEQVAGLGPYQNLLPQIIEIELFDHKCKVLNIDALIKAKQQMNRPKDKETIVQLEAIKDKLTS
ncbi:MAG: hypothetical protein ABH859_02185 [Pseudomonadota bacterium]